MDCVEAGRLGGKTRAKKYVPLARKVVWFFVCKPDMTQEEIALKIGVSQAFVSKYTNNLYIKQARINNSIKKLVKDLTEEDLNRLLLKAKLESIILSHKDDVKTLRERKTKI